MEYRWTSLFAVDAIEEKSANTEFAYKKTNAIGDLGDRFQVLEKKSFLSTSNVFLEKI